MQQPRDPATRRDLLGATLFALLAALAVAAVWTAPPPALDVAAGVITWLRAGDDVAGRAIVTTALAALAVLGYIVAWARATSPRRPVRAGGGRGTIAVDALAGWLRGEVLELPDVRDVRVRVENRRRRGVRVSLAIAVTPHARLAETAGRASERVESVLREEAGIGLAEPPAIALSYDELILGSRPHDASRDEPAQHRPSRSDAA